MDRLNKVTYYTIMGLASPFILLDIINVNVINTFNSLCIYVTNNSFLTEEE